MLQRAQFVSSTRNSIYKKLCWCFKWEKRVVFLSPLPIIIVLVVPGPTAWPREAVTAILILLIIGMDTGPFLEGIE
jgi:hypothetical protein